MGEANSCKPRWPHTNRHSDGKERNGGGMTHYEAIAILERVKAGDKGPTLAQITTALILTGDIDAAH